MGNPSEERASSRIFKCGKINVGGEILQELFSNFICDDVHYKTNFRSMIIAIICLSHYCSDINKCDINGLRSSARNWYDDFKAISIRNIDVSKLASWNYFAI